MSLDVSRRGFLSLLIGGPVALAVAPRFIPPAELVTAAPALTHALEHMRRTLLGFSPQMVQPGRIVQLIAMPQRPFRPRRLLVDARTCAAFELLHLSAAGEPQIEDAVPLELFSPLAVGIESHIFSSVMPGERIVIAARNISNYPQQLNAAIMGEALIAGPELVFGEGPGDDDDDDDDDDDGDDDDDDDDDDGDDDDDDDGEEATARDERQGGA